MAEPSREDPLQPSHVWMAYTGMLGREPSPPEIEHQLASLTTTGELLDVIMGSEEYAARVKATPAAVPTSPPPSRINWWHPDSAAHTHAVGTVSEGGIAVVGHRGWLFLCGGSNSILGQFVGDVPMDDDWARGWIGLMEHRTREMGRGGRLTASIVVPDKLAVYQEDYPTELRPHQARPVERLLNEFSLPLIYPADELRAARGDGPVYLRTDTHFSYRGNHVLYAAVMAELGLQPLPFSSLAATVPHVVSGDLGSKFGPAIVEVVEAPGTMGTATVVEDNRDEVARTGGHIGSRRVYRNEAAIDDRCVVLYGDSYGFGSTAYQGLGWFMAQHFREVHFVWTPFGWDGAYADRVGAQIVVSETAERFVPRVPARDVDVDALVVAAVSRAGGVSPDAVFTDRPHRG
ncbi:alginate O-acetyltransferase AlgX-related protein [Patulibacter americanus]|uniref:alginate O-acetyltransferase AlgX-related protein n=1 Tax=Patulibacter americanus TaxID=588672 RepID=UPI0003B42D10|nr:hypothetical protein [Patulibacter americanus]